MPNMNSTENFDIITNIVSLFFPVWGWGVRCLLEELVISSNGIIWNFGVSIQSSTIMAKCWQKVENWLQHCRRSPGSQARINQPFTWLTQQSVFQSHSPPETLSESPHISQAIWVRSWLMPSFQKAQEVLKPYKAGFVSKQIISFIFKQNFSILPKGIPCYIFN